MKRTLLLTSALAFAGAVAAGPALAADKMSVGVGGYMEQWIGMADRTDDGADGGIDIQSDSEIYFKGSLESDMGLKFGFQVQLEANNGGSGATSIDESNAWISGDFGHIDFGARDPVYTRMHEAAAFGAGVGLNAGDTQKWIPGAYLETAGWTMSGDDLTLSYTSPRVNGIQVGLSYTADTTSENSVTSAPTNNDQAAMGVGLNYKETVGDMAVKLSLGHINVGNAGSVMYDHDGDAGTDDQVKGFDDRTYTNMGLSVGMGAFSFGFSYATRDDGGFVASGNSVVEDGSGKHDTVAVGLKYTDGPMSWSVDMMNRDADNGDERTGTMVSMGYRLAPGVDWKTSLFSVEDTGSGAEGTAFVTGIDMGF